MNIDQLHAVGSRDAFLFTRFLGELVGLGQRHVPLFFVLLPVDDQSDDIRGSLGIVSVEMRHFIPPVFAGKLVDGIGFFAISEERSKETDDPEDIFLWTIVGGHHLQTDQLWRVPCEDVLQDDVV